MYIVCYTRNDKYENGTVLDYVEEFDDFAQAVQEYTLQCGCKCPSVVLADTDTKQILKQYCCSYYYSRGGKGEGIGRDTIG